MGSMLPFGGPAEKASSGRSLIALSLDEGEVQWTAGEDQISYASAMVLSGWAATNCFSE